MKKLLGLFCVIAILASSLTAFATAEKVLLSGTAIEVGTILERDDRTFISAACAETIWNFFVSYTDTVVDGTTRKSVAITDENAVSYLLIEGNNFLYALPGKVDDTNGKVVTMDTVPFINEADGQMYIPLRFFAEAAGYQVGWDEATLTVTINK